MLQVAQVKLMPKNQTIWDANEKPILSNTFGAQITVLHAGHGPIGFNVTLLNSLALNQFFLDNLSSLPFEVALFANVC